MGDRIKITVTEPRGWDAVTFFAGCLTLAAMIGLSVVSSVLMTTGLRTLGLPVWLHLLIGALLTVALSLCIGHSAGVFGGWLFGRLMFRTKTAIVPEGADLVEETEKLINRKH